MAVDFIEQLRKKPIAYRRRVLLFSTSIITGIIFIVWLFTFDSSVKAIPTDSAASATALQPLSEIETNVGSFIDTVKTMTAGIFGGAARSSR